MYMMYLRKEVHTNAKRLCSGVQLYAIQLQKLNLLLYTSKIAAAAHSMPCALQCTHYYH
jgi:hypothetical protein